MTLLNDHKNAVTHYLQHVNGITWKCYAGTGQSNSGSFVRGGLLLGVFNLDNYPTQGGDLPLTLFGLVTGISGTDLYLAVLIDEQRQQALQELKRLTQAGVRLNNVRAYLTGNGHVVFEKDYLESVEAVTGHEILIDSAIVFSFSSTPDFQSDAHFRQLVGIRFSDLVMPRPVRFVDLDSGTTIIQSDQSTPQLSADQIMPVNTEILASLASKPFLILTGPSGTGKTRLMREMVHYLRPAGYPADYFHAFVAVEADWTDARHLLGYYNPFGNEGKGSYEITPVLKVLLRASLSDHFRVPFFIILDEMNLSHVERYFARFLSLMETRGHGFDRGEQLLSVDDLQAARRSTEDEALQAAIDQAVDVGGLLIPPNVFFAGTVNVDETTYMFSPKVLDRAFVYEFHSAPPSRLALTANNADTRPHLSPRMVADFLLSNDPAQSVPMTLAGVDEYNSMHQAFFGTGNSGSPEAPDPDALMDRLNGILAGMGFPITGRPTAELRRFLFNRARLSLLLPSAGLMTMSTTLDALLMVKVLPKVHGGRSQLKEGLEGLQKLCADKGATRAGNKVDRMLRQLKDTGYCSYIS